MKPVVARAHTIGHMIGESRGSQIVEEVPPIPTLPPREEWCDAGNPDITDWCKVCEARVVPMASGTCGWCDTPVTLQARADATRRELNRRAGYRRYRRTPPPLQRKPRQTIRHKVLDALQEPKTTPELSELTGHSVNTIRNVIAELQRANEIKSTRKVRVGERTYLKVYTRAAA